MGNSSEKAARQARNVLVLSASKKVALVQRFQRAFRELGMANSVVWAGDVSENVLAKIAADKVWRMPRLSKISAQEFGAFCKDNDIQMVVPTRDGELTFFAAHAAELKSSFGITVHVSAPPAIDFCVDKYKYYKTCKQNGIPAIATYLSLEDLLKEHPGCTSLVLKQRFGAGAKDMHIGISPADAAQIADQTEHPIFQPMVNGTEYSVDCYVNLQGEVVCVVPRTRNLVVNGESAVTITQDSQKLIDHTIAMLKCAPGLFGHAVVQAFILEDGSVQFIETNARFGGASSLGMEAGCDSCKWFVKECNGEHIEKSRDYKIGLKMSRLPTDSFVQIK